MKSVILPEADLQALEAGRKTMFRMPMNPQVDTSYWKPEALSRPKEWRKMIMIMLGPGYHGYDENLWCLYNVEDKSSAVPYTCRKSPYLPGEVIYVKNSSFKLKILTAGVERVQKITEEDCFSEGIENICENNLIAEATWSPIPDFIYYWDIRYSKKPRYQWAQNPWVWKFGIERIDNAEN